MAGLHFKMQDCQAYSDGAIRRRKERRRGDGKRTGRSTYSTFCVISFAFCFSIPPSAPAPACAFSPPPCYYWHAILLTIFLYFQVDETLPQAVEGTKLRIRQPFNRQLVSVVLGGSEVKLEKLDSNTSNTTGTATGLNLADSASLDDKTIVSTPLKPRKSFEQHLRECAERYAASEEGQRAAAARQERLENTKAAAAQDQETAVNMSMNKDAAALTAATNKKVQNLNALAKKQKQSTQALVGGAKSLPLKRPLDAAAGAAAYQASPPAQRSRIVDFLSDEDFTAIQQQQNTAVDLSRFGSDSEDDDGGEKGLGKINGKNNVDGIDLSRFGSESDEEEGEDNVINDKRTIPQVDGAADTETDSESESESEKKSASGDDDDSSSSSGEDDDNDSSSSSESESESEKEEEEENGDGGGGDTKMVDVKKISSSDGGSDSAEDTSDSSEDEDDDEKKTEADAKEELPVNGGGSGGGEASWMAKYLPAGASFFRQDPLVQVEGAWRAGREAAVREYKERRRQAMRQAGKSGGGGGGGKRRKE